MWDRRIDAAVAGRQPARRRRSASRARTRSGCAALGAVSHARAAELRLGPVKRHAMSAIFNFEALLLVLLLMICTATYLKDQPLVGPKMEANKFGCVAATSLLLCSNRVAHEPLGALSNSKSDRGPGCAPAPVRWMLPLQRARLVCHLELAVEVVKNRCVSRGALPAPSAPLLLLTDLLPATARDAQGSG